MHPTRFFSALLLFVAFSLCSSGASDRPARTPSVRSWEMVATNGSVNNYFGSSVAISGNTAVVGNRTGQAYVYEKPASGWGNMVQTAELTSDKGGSFGPSVAISGNTIVVGSGTPDGEAYVFVKPASGWTNMTETARLSDGVSGDYFGVSVAIEGDTIVVGASGATINGNEDQGAAYVFVKPATGWATTSAFNAMLTASDGGLEDFLGLSVAVSGKTVVAGQPDHDDQTGPGVVYVFVEPATGWAAMTQTAELTQTVRGPYDEFGFSVAICGSTIVAGAPQANQVAGAAYVFVEPATGWANMTETAELTTSGSVAHYGLGTSVATTGKQVATGSEGFVFAYADPETGWQSTSTPSVTLNGGQENAEFGYSVAIGSGVIVVGAPYETVHGNTNRGLAFGFD
jgi:FG-GAP repeat